MKVYVIIKDWHNDGQYEDSCYANNVFVKVCNTFEKAIEVVCNLVYRIQPDDMVIDYFKILDAAVYENGKEENGRILVGIRDYALDEGAGSDIYTYHEQYYIEEVEVIS